MLSHGADFFIDWPLWHRYLAHYELNGKAVNFSLSLCFCLAVAVSLDKMANTQDKSLQYSLIRRAHIAYISYDP